MLLHVHRAEFVFTWLHIIVHYIPSASLLELVLVGRLRTRRKTGHVFHIVFVGTLEPCLLAPDIVADSFSILFQNSNQIAIVLHELLGGGPLFLGHFHTHQNELLGLVGEVGLELIPDQRHGYMVFQLTLRLTEGIRRLPMQQLVHQHSESPNVSFRTIKVVDQPLGRHVDRRTNVYILETLSKIR